MTIKIWLSVTTNEKNLKRKIKIRENEILERHSVELPEGDEKEREKKKKVLLSTKKNMNRDRDLKCITQKEGKRKIVGLKSFQDVDKKLYYNKERIEQKLRECTEMHFSKVKESKAHEDKYILI